MNGSGYFGALLRSAGVAPLVSRHDPEPLASGAAAEAVFDPFESAIEIDPGEGARLPIDAGDAGPAPVRDAPMPPAGEEDRPISPAMPEPAHHQPQPLPAELRGAARLSIQAALRWVAADSSQDPIEPSAPRTRAVAAPAGEARAAPMIERLVAPTPEPAGPAKPRPAHEPVQALAQEKPDPPATRAERLIERVRDPEATTDPDRGPPSVRSLPTAPSSQSSPGERTEVHIRTLHVTLDAAATARFATHAVAQANNTSVASAEPPRAGNSRNAHAAQGAEQGSSLSRSRLPRW